MKHAFRIFLLLLFLFGTGFAYLIHKTNIYVTAEFKNLRPFHYKAPIYYNGYKIGRILKIKPNSTYNSTIITMELHPKDLKIPTNVSLILKKEKDKDDKKFDYMDMIFPKHPSGYYLKTGDRISGKTTIELDTYLSNQDPESLDEIKAEIAETVKNLNLTVQSLGDLFFVLTSIAEDIRPNIVKSSKNLNSGTSNLVSVTENAKNISSNFEKTLNYDRLNMTTQDFQASSNNVRALTQNTNEMVTDIRCTIEQVNKILCNTHEITSGVNKTMKKQFGGFRLFFGKPVNNTCD